MNETDQHVERYVRELRDKLAEAYPGRWVIFWTPGAVACEAENTRGTRSRYNMSNRAIAAATTPPEAQARFGVEWLQERLDPSSDPTSRLDAIVCAIIELNRAPIVPTYHQIKDALEDLVK